MLFGVARTTVLHLHETEVRTSGALDRSAMAASSEHGQAADVSANERDVSAPAFATIIELCASAARDGAQVPQTPVEMARRSSGGIDAMGAVTQYDLARSTLGATCAMGGRSYGWRMPRRAMALLMLFVAAASCMSQGLALVLCRCSGDVFVGSAPEVCCQDCGPVEPVCVIDKQQSCGTSEGCGVEGCWQVLARGWDRFTPASSRETAPVPLVVDAVAPSHPCTRFAMPDLVVGLAEKRLNRPEPPGRPHALLHGSLRI